MNKDLINEFYTKSSPEEKCQFLWLIANEVMIPLHKVHEDGTKYVDCMLLDKEMPVVMNGICYQFNTEDFFNKK
jgi:hypothetical protein